MKHQLISMRYAEALYQNALEAGGIVNEVKESLESFLQTIRQLPEALKFLKNPFFSKESRLDFIKKHLVDEQGPSGQLLHNFILVLFKKNRFDFIYEIELCYAEIVRARAGIREAEIRSAYALSEALEKDMVDRLQKFSGGKVILKKYVDPTLVGGVLVKIGNKILDGSVRFKMNQMKTRLKELSV